MRIVICDNDVLCAEKCKSMLEKLSKKHDVNSTIEIVKSGKALIFCLETKFSKMDLVYLDVNMPDGDGLTTARELRKRNSAVDIVFYTVDETHAIEGYDVGALNYILKGKSDDDKFENVFLKAKSRAEERTTEIIALSCAGEHRNIQIKDILYFEVKDHIITVHYKNMENYDKFEFYSTLKKIEESLYGFGMQRIHNSYLVSPKYMLKKNQRQVEMTNGETLPVGKSFRKKISL